MKNDQSQHTPSNTNPRSITRRDILKGLAAVPVLGAFSYAWFRKNNLDEAFRKQMREVVNLTAQPVELAPSIQDGKPIRVGIIGFGIRGKQLLRAAGFPEPSWIDDQIKAHAENRQNTNYQSYMEQEQLNIEITGVCDVFSVYSEQAALTASNINREGSKGKMGKAPRQYKTYLELLDAPDIDAVIIASPDHWHAPMAIEAAKRGKHVYCEKPVSWTVPETYELVKVVKEKGIVFQLGHQGRQTESYTKAKEAIEKNVLGKVNLIEVCTNRNDPNGAWVYDIHPEANPSTIDWKQFIGQAPWHDFSLERFFRWRCWWDYSTGLNGDLLTHEYDALNQIMGLGIPESVASSGGIYFFKDGRTVPDVLHVVMEFPKRDLSFLYSATLASDRSRGKVIMGHDANMEISDRLVIKADPQSTQYKQKIESGLIDPNTPIYSFTPGKKGADGFATATEQYFASRGLLYTYRNGKRVDTTHLHIKEWLNCIRAGVQPSCNIDQAFDEGISAHMSTKALLENRKVFWDADKQLIV
ncbi:MAG: Gfo/Idh/MocA family oxidoreductase [Bacteroidales bacterium]|nr:Gfo/Idh/MocA family oxidoreductase [Bacteroidales bacterium]